MEAKKKKARVVKDKKPASAAKKIIRNLIITIIAAFAYFYIALPAINLHNPDFYGFFIVLSLFYCALTGLSSMTSAHADEPQKWVREFGKNVRMPLYICAALVVLFIGGALLSSVIFRSGAYSELITINRGDFRTDVEEVHYDRIPMLDKDSAERVGIRKLGELEDMVSQFEVVNNYTQINYGGRPVRVATLRYGDIFKWLGNMSEGLPAYMIVDMVNQQADVVRLSQGMKYTPADHFGRNLTRHLRFNYPTFMFDTPHFEINDSGEPYWVCPKIEKTIGLFGGTDIRGAVLVNAVTGECEYYEQVPTWVDAVYSGAIIEQQYDYYGMYQNGFWNSMFGQKGCTVTTDDYGYIAMHDDVYVYTGITSVGGDESNIGFILCNQRTKQTTYYSYAGAEEYSAKESAQGIVQHLDYTATFPLLLNIAGEPTYFMSLKDQAGLVKMFAMVYYPNYTIVASGTTVQECERAYLELLAQHGIIGADEVLLTGMSGKIAEARSAVIDGNTFYYFRLEGDDFFYRVSAASSENAVIISVGDSVSIEASTDQGDIRPAAGIKKE